MTPPRLLVVDNLLKPFERTRGTLEQIRGKLPAAQSESIELKGLFVQIIAAIGTALIEAQVSYARVFPEKWLTPHDSLTVPVELLHSHALTADVVSEIVEQKAEAASFGAFHFFLDEFSRKCAIDQPPINPMLLNTLIEANATRNALLHRDLRANRKYRNDAGRLNRAHANGGRLSLTTEYVSRVCEASQALMDEMQHRLSEKYAKYTRHRAITELWNWMFPTPLMKGRLDEYFCLGDNGTLFAIRSPPLENALSHSEVSLLRFWRENVISLYISGLDDNNRAKLLWFIETLATFSLVSAEHFD